MSQHVVLLSLTHTGAWTLPSTDADRKKLLRFKVFFKGKINKTKQHGEDQTCHLEQNWSDSLPGIPVLFLQYVASTFSLLAIKIGSTPETTFYIKYTLVCQFMQISNEHH